MKCPKCGRVYADNVAFCPVDDAVLMVSESPALTNEPGGLRPGIASTSDRSSIDDRPAASSLAAEPVDPDPPRMVEPIGPPDDADVDTIIRPKPPLVEQNPAMRTRMNVPMPPRPMANPGPFVPVHPHPPAANSNPWKVAFLAMLGVLAIGGILFWLLRSNPNAQNANTPALVADPSSSPLLTASPPNGVDENTVPAVATPPPYGGANANVNITPTPLPPNANVNANVEVPPMTPTPTPSPRNLNQNSANANTGATPTPGPRPSPSSSPMGRPTPPITGTAPPG